MTMLDNASVAHESQVNPQTAAPREYQLALTVRDPDIISALWEQPETARGEFALAALRVGVLAIRQASGQLDAERIRREADDLVSKVKSLIELEWQNRADRLFESVTTNLETYLDPTNGHLKQQLQRLLDDNGDLQKLLESNLSPNNSTFARTLSQVVGNDSDLMKYLSKDQKDGLLDLLERQVREQLDQQAKKVLDEFSLDNPNGALSRLIAKLDKSREKLEDNFSLDKDDSALSRLKKLLEETHREIEDKLTLDKESPLKTLQNVMTAALAEISKQQQQFQEQIFKTLANLRARKEEAARGTNQGRDFETLLCDLIKHRGMASEGDKVEFVGDKTEPRTQRKVGDVLITLGLEHVANGQKIIIEAKNAAGVSEEQALQQLQEARANREAAVGIVVWKHDKAPHTIRQFLLKRRGFDVLTSWDDADGSTDLHVQAALSVARALVATKKANEAKQDSYLGDIDKAIEDLKKALDELRNLESQKNTISKATNRMERSIAKMQTLIEVRMDWLKLVAGSLRTSSETSTAA